MEFTFRRILLRTTEGFLRMLSGICLFRGYINHDKLTGEKCLPLRPVFVIDLLPRLGDLLWICEELNHGSRLIPNKQLDSDMQLLTLI